MNKHLRTILAASLTTLTVVTIFFTLHQCKQLPEIFSGSAPDDKQHTYFKHRNPLFKDALTHFSELQKNTLQTVKSHKKTDTLSASDITPQLPEDTVFYRDGFFYHPITEDIKRRISGISYPVYKAEALSENPVNTIADDEAIQISYDDLAYLSVLHYDFNGEVQTGELICNKKLAPDILEIFHELYLNKYQIEKMRLVDEYKGDDTASMLDNNTSAFNYRVVDGTSRLSRHALGCAIDINPFYNPYIVFNKNNTGETYISPKGSEIYADRSLDFPHKIDENDLCYKLFKEHGFTWGGDWSSCKDYQHFEYISTIAP